MFEGVESDDAKRAVIVTNEHVTDYRFNIGFLYLSSPVTRADLKAIDDEIRGFVRANGDDSR